MAHPEMWQTYAVSIQYEYLKKFEKVCRPSNGLFYLKNSNTSGFADIARNYGIRGDKLGIGDWNNDGIETAPSTCGIPTRL